MPQFCNFSLAVQIVAVLAAFLLMIFQAALISLHFVKKQHIIINIAEIFAAAIMLVTVCVLSVACIEPEKVTGGYNNAVFILSIITLLLGIVAVIFTVTDFSNLKNGISSKSIVEALDTINAGVVFARKNGKIILANKTMKQLSVAITQKELQNASSFFNLLFCFRDNESASKFNSGKKLIFKLSDGSSYEFSKHTFSVKNKEYFSIFAKNITSEVSTAEEIEKTLSDIHESENELQWVFDNLDSIKKEKELFSSDFEHHERLRKCSKNLFGCLATPEFDCKGFSDETALLLHTLYIDGCISGAEILQSMCNALEYIGVSVTVLGNIPNDCYGVLPEILCDISSSVVRLVYPPEITVALYEGGNKITMAVTVNTSAFPKEEICSEKFNQIKNTVLSRGGTVEFTTGAVFKATVSLPK